MSKSEFTNVSMSRTIENCTLKDWIQLLIFILIFSKWTVSFHEIIDIDNFPDTKSIFTKPFD